jgi:hypothetical protein
MARSDRDCIDEWVEIVRADAYPGGPAADEDLERGLCRAMLTALSGLRGSRSARRATRHWLPADEAACRREAIALFSAAYRVVFGGEVRLEAHACRGQGGAHEPD